MRTTPSVRGLTAKDSPSVAGLTVQLGYELDPGTAASRIESVLEAEGHHAFGAFLDEKLIGYLHCFDRPSIEKGRGLVVQALVVDETIRGTGAGRLLMAEAERLARDLGCTSVSLSSGERRAGAHAFYERLGYLNSSVSRFFTKTL
ncbi:GNAT family N-acetyltransferase [Nisaea sediminum]|uniref:GNAT family N-acetyltransferase n=1 Tax=Nisaea sediminum TaxID=2775867 RepID=UPI001865BA34|nr:GNAT family N-acetyltransferase [Nisaea sediminum]